MCPPRQVEEVAVGVSNLVVRVVSVLPVLGSQGPCGAWHGLMLLLPWHVAEVSGRACGVPTATATDVLGYSVLNLVYSVGN